MKKILIPFFYALFIVLSIETTGQPTLTFKLDNPRIARMGPAPNPLNPPFKTRFLFDVYVKASATGTYWYSSQIAFNVANSAYFTTTAASIYVDVTGLAGQGYYYNAIGQGWTTGNASFGFAITADVLGWEGSPAQDFCMPMTTFFQKIATIGIEIKTTGGVSGTAGITFNPANMPAGSLQQQRYALFDEIIERSYIAHSYSEPNSFEGRDLSDVYMGRIYSSGTGWSQYQTTFPDGLPHTFWKTAVNTSVWDTLTTGPSAATIDTSGSKALALRIHTGARLKIKPATNLTCTGATEINAPQGLWIASDATGTGSFIDNGTITYNTGGTARVERYFPNDSHWHYWSMPVTSSTAQPFTGLFMRWFEEPTYLFKEIIEISTPLHVMWGYSVAANGINATVGVTGSLNSGTFTSPTLTSTNVPSLSGYDGWNFVGNPYPSSINWMSSGYTKTGIDATKYTWDGSVYQTYNMVDSTVGANRFIKPEQGFFVHVTTNGGTGSIAVNNTARVHFAGSYNKKATGTNDKLVLIATANGIDDEAHVVFSSDATLNFDPDYDAYKLMGISHAPNLYSLLPSDIIAAINWLPWTSPSQIVPMGFSCGLSGAYHITASNLESFSSATEIYIEDLKENITQDLIKDPVYHFNYSKGEETNRFLLHFANPTLGVNDPQGSKIQIYAYDDIVYVKHLSSGDIHGTVLIYDITGQKVFSGKLENLLLNKFRLTITTGFYVVKVQTGQAFVTGKVFLNQK